jgi:hypothetical protein
MLAVILNVAVIPSRKPAEHTEHSISQEDAEMQIGTSDLQYRYSWQAKPGDDATLRGFPDNILLNTEEGYEVLDFINRCLRQWDKSGTPLDLADAKKIERMLQAKPGGIRSHAKVQAWLLAEWNKY